MSTTNSNKGKLIVLDGLDGSGKSTQFEIVSGKLEKLGYTVKAITFPDYSEPSSTLVKMYLSGEFSKTAGGVNAYAASSFYAVDRYASYKRFWERNYQNGDVILASRYTTSNAIHQMSKLDNGEWDNYLKWLEEYEYTKLGLPKPNKVIFLDMAIEVSQKLLLQRYEGDKSKRDIHETDIEYLKSCRKSATFAANALDWEIIKCDDGQAPKTIDEITKKIMNTIIEVI